MNRLGERAVASLWIALGAILVLSSFDVRLIQGTSDFWGPRIFPQLIGAALAVGGSWILVSDIASARRRNQPGDDVVVDEPVRTESAFDSRVSTGAPTGSESWTARTSLSILVVAGYLVLLPILGYIPATIVASAGMLLVMGVKRWKFVLPFSVALALGAYLAFGLLLGVRLP